MIKSTNTLLEWLINLAENTWILSFWAAVCYLILGLVLFFWSDREQRNWIKAAAVGFFLLASRALLHSLGTLSMENHHIGLAALFQTLTPLFVPLYCLKFFEAGRMLLNAKENLQRWALITSSVAFLPILFLPGGWGRPAEIFLTLLGLASLVRGLAHVSARYKYVTTCLVIFSMVFVATCMLYLVAPWSASLFVEWHKILIQTLIERTANSGRSPSALQVLDSVTIAATMVSYIGLGLTCLSLARLRVRDREQELQAEVMRTQGREQELKAEVENFAAALGYTVVPRLLNHELKNRAQHIQFATNDLKAAYLGQGEMSQEMVNAIAEVETSVESFKRLLEATNRNGEEDASSTLASAIAWASDNFKEFLRVRKIEWQLAGEFEYQVKLSKELLQLCLSTIIVNAIDAIGSQGWIRLSISHHNATVILEISNNGKPIEEKIVDRIFDFGTTTKGKGGGLGLGLCRASLKRHGATLSLVRSNRDETCFRIEMLNAG